MCFQGYSQGPSVCRQVKKKAANGFQQPPSQLGSPQPEKQQPISRGEHSIASILQLMYASRLYWGRRLAPIMVSTFAETSTNRQRKWPLMAQVNAWISSPHPSLPVPIEGGVGCRWERPPHEFCLPACTRDVPFMCMGRRKAGGP